MFGGRKSLDDFTKEPASVVLVLTFVAMTTESRDNRSKCFCPFVSLFLKTIITNRGLSGAVDCSTTSTEMLSAENSQLCSDE